MPRNLDLTALRSFVTVADAAGVTRAAGLLNLTQSAVSMQLKRLEESLDARLLDRSARQITLTTAGEQLLGYARRIMDLNDEVFSRMTDQVFEGEVVLGVPGDIVYPAIPTVLRRFNAIYPKMRVQLLSSFTVDLKNLFEQGKCDLILTTEDESDPGAETLAELPLVWYGAQNGTAWRGRPLRLAYPRSCKFRRSVQAALDRSKIPWEIAVESDSIRAVEASVIADLAVFAQLDGMPHGQLEPIKHGGALPDLGSNKINLYVAEAPGNQVLDDLAVIVRQAYGPARLVPLRASA